MFCKRLFNAGQINIHFFTIKIYLKEELSVQESDDDY